MEINTYNRVKMLWRTVFLTPLSSLLLGAVDVVLQLDADLPLVGQVSDERVFEELLGAGSLAVAFHQTALYERLELLGPETKQTHT